MTFSFIMIPEIWAKKHEMTKDKFCYDDPSRVPFLISNFLFLAEEIKCYFLKKKTLIKTKIFIRLLRPFLSTLLFFKFTFLFIPIILCL